jgi:hypothetical protein
MSVSKITAGVLSAGADGRAAGILDLRDMERTRIANSLTSV